MRKEENLTRTCRCGHHCGKQIGFVCGPRRSIQTTSRNCTPEAEWEKSLRRCIYILFVPSCLSVSFFQYVQHQRDPEVANGRNTVHSWDMSYQSEVSRSLQETVHYRQSRKERPRECGSRPEHCPVQSTSYSTQICLFTMLNPAHD